MQITSNKRLLNLISKHEVGIIYPNLIPYIARNIVLQRNNTILDPYQYPYFSNWFYWANTKEGPEYWSRINRTLLSIDNKDD